jgi:hypothetical protein
MATFTVSGKALGARRPLFADWSVPLPPEWSGEGGLRLRDLIARVVGAEVQAFRDRQEQRQIFRTLTAREISAGVAEEDCRTIIWTGRR